MIKIFRYELRRLLFNKFFIGLLLVTLFYCWQVLSSEIIQGVSHTAPFSPWSFGCYLARISPLICLGELFFLTFYTSSRERRASVITSATPVDPRKYMLVRCGAVLLCVLLLAICVLLLGFGFYAKLLGWADFGSLIAPALLALLPPIMFFLGVGWLLGRVHPALTYISMAVPFLLAYIQVPFALDMSGYSFFADYPLTLDALDPVFAVPLYVLGSRTLYMLLGVLLLLTAVSCSRSKQH